MRINPLAVPRAHWKSLSNRAGGKVEPNWRARIFSVAVAVVPTLWVLLATRNGVAALDASIPSAILAAAAILVGGLLAAFGVLVGWRATLQEQAERYPATQQGLRGLVDEAVSHILLAVLWSAAVLPLATLLLVCSGRIASVLLALIVGLSAHTLYLFVLIVPLLYSAYTQIMDVESSINGLVRQH